MKKLLILLFLCFHTVFAKFNVHEFKLPNGLTVVCIEKNILPIVHVAIYYKCGSNNDALGKSGVAHYLEHMAFSNDEGFVDFLDSIGAEKNAFTSANMICFYEIVPAFNVETILKNEADRMRNLNMQDKVFLSEKKAILEERGMRVDNDPDGAFNEVFLANIFNRRKGGIGPIGWKHEIENIAQIDLRDFHDKWFAPNNAVVVIVGDFVISDVKRLVTKHFGDIKRKNIPSVKEESSDHQLCREISYSTTKRYGANVVYAYRVPFSANERKTTALDIAIQALNSPTFYVKKIVKNITHKALDISFGYIWQEYNEDLVFLDVSTDSLDSLDEVESIWHYLKFKIANIGISQADLDLVKRKRLLALAYQNEDVSNISRYFARLLVKGYSVKQILSRDDLIQSITLKECNEALRDVFTCSHIAIAKMSRKGRDHD